MNIAAIIVGIDGWGKYTLPLVQSLRDEEPECHVVIVDNASEKLYPIRDSILHTGRLCYSAAINAGKRHADFLHQKSFDWYIVLSNDVLCTGPFAHILAEYDGNDLVGPLMLETPIPGMGMVPYIEGWCMIFSRRVWNAIGGMDDSYLMSSFEDVDASQSAREEGFGLLEDKRLPFTHLDQRQRFHLPGYSGSEAHNMQRFIMKHARVTA